MSIPSGTVLRTGDSGEYVRLLQQALVDNNFYPDANASNNGVDGIYGPNTVDAVRRYQIMNGLTVDGIAGAQVLHSLGLLDSSSGGGVEITLRLGHSGAEVRRLQEALVDNNFYPNIEASNNGVDGVYGANTEDAVRRYQIMNGLTVDGIAGPQTLIALGLSGGGTGGSGSITIRVGDRGENVRLLQQALVNNNFYPDINAANYGVDGIYGPDTQNAVRRFQIMKGLSVDGIAGSQTLGALGISGGGSASSGNSGSYRGTLRSGDSGDAVRLLQQALVDNNFYPDASAPNNGVDGIYGPNTKDAVRRYQIMNGLTVDGIAGPQTLASLGLNGGSSGGSSGNGGDSGEDGGLDFSGGHFKDFTVTQSFIPQWHYNRPGYGMNPRYITVHETANKAPGATAFMHANYVRNPNTQESWHFTVDDSGIVYQHLPLNETGFHAGDGAGDGNRNSIGIELCVNSSGDFSKTRKNAATLIRSLMNDFVIPIENVVPHNHWKRKNCPANLLYQFGRFQDQIMDSTPPDIKSYEVTSPFADVSEWYSSRDKEKGTTISFDTAYDVKIGPLSGQLTGAIIFGDPNKVDWKLEANRAIDGEFLESNFDQAVNAVFKASLIPAFSSVAEAQEELKELLSNEIFKNVETRLKGPDFKIDSFFHVDITWLSLEVLRKEATNVYTKESIELKEIDWDDYKDKFNLELVYVLVLIALILLGLGWSVPNVARYLINPLTVGA
ncbi:hypothetical protein OBCHQ24_02960 [Oceanobacillus iheyensis]|nr:hypothetical protein OBCHQ24_02960 [Oceanobacillus iheyensis]